MPYANAIDVLVVSILRMLADCFQCRAELWLLPVEGLCFGMMIMNSVSEFALALYAYLRDQLLAKRGLSEVFAKRNEELSIRNFCKVV